MRTFGCQMNEHDSERIAGLLSADGLEAAATVEDADVVVLNTCCIRENADNKLYGNLGHLAPVKADRPGMQIAVGGCLAQKDRSTIVDRAPWVDVVFGTHNMGSLPSLLERARHNGDAALEILESLEVFPSTLPTKRDSVSSGWVSGGLSGSIIGPFLWRCGRLRRRLWGDGRGGRDPIFGGVSMGSATVARQLREAAAVPGVRAVVLVATVLLWIGAELTRRIEWLLPYSGGLGVLMVVGGFIYELWKSRAARPPSSKEGDNQPRS